MATKAADPVFVDTNVLVAANVSTHPLHATAGATLQALAGAGVALWISRQVIREYLATLTRPQTFSAPQPMTVLKFQVNYFLTHFLVAEDGPQVTTNLLALLAVFPTGGRQVHDANIVATMQAYGAGRLLTHNTADFARFRTLITILPL